MFSIGDKVLVYERTSIDSELFTIKGEAQITNITSRTLKLKFKFLGIIPYQRCFFSIFQ